MKGFETRMSLPDPSITHVTWPPTVPATPVVLKPYRSIPGEPGVCLLEDFPLPVSMERWPVTAKLPKQTCISNLYTHLYSAHYPITLAHGRLESYSSGRLSCSRHFWLLCAPRLAFCIFPWRNNFSICNLPVLRAREVKRIASRLLDSIDLLRATAH